MVENSSALSWFYQQLTLDEQVELIADPYGPLPGQLSERLALRPGISTSWWASNTGSHPWTLEGTAARKLSTARGQLDLWWQGLESDQKSYLLENRAGEIDDSYKSVVQGANRDPFSDPDAYLVVIVQDANNGHRFMLPPVIRAYVEMRASDQD